MNVAQTSLQLLAQRATQWLVLGAVFFGAILLVVGGYAFATRRRLAAEQLVRRRLLDEATPTAVVAPARIMRDRRTASAVGFVDRLLARQAFTGAVQLQLDRAGSGMTVGTFLMTTGLCGGVCALVGARAAGWLTAVALGALGLLLPFVSLRSSQTKRRKAFEQQLPGAVDMLVNAMRAGYSLQAAMKFVGDEVGDPLGPEFIRVHDEQRLGIDVRTALGNLQTRNTTLDVKMFVTALLIQRESGGNLAEIMTNLSVLMRERVVLRGQLDVLTAEPKMSAVVLTLLPIALFAALNAMNPDYVLPLYTTDSGRLLLAYSVVSLAVGYVALARLGRIDL